MKGETMEKLYKTTEVADVLGIAPNTLEIWRIRGDGPKFVKCGRYVRYRRQDIEEYIERRTARSTTAMAMA
jgi:predicted DNA-binding transcriptional regulator AlpA